LLVRPRFAASSRVAGLAACAVVVERLDGSDDSSNGSDEVRLWLDRYHVDGNGVCADS
jgi:hypothetical protein